MIQTNWSSGELRPRLSKKSLLAKIILINLTRFAFVSFFFSHRGTNHLWNPPVAAADMWTDVYCRGMSSVWAGGSCSRVPTASECLARGKLFVHRALKNAHFRKRPVFPPLLVAPWCRPVLSPEARVATRGNAQSGSHFREQVRQSRTDGSL